MIPEIIGVTVSQMRESNIILVRLLICTELEEIKLMINWKNEGLKQ